MFAVISLRHAVSPTFGMTVQFLNSDGSCNDLTVLEEYLNQFSLCAGITTTTRAAAPHGTNHAVPPNSGDGSQLCIGSHAVRRRDWFLATADEAGGPGTSRAKYKSAYFKRGFTEAQARCMYKHMHRTLPGADLTGAVIEIDSYGGAINRRELIQSTAVCQRSSVIKIQPMAFWRDTEYDSVYSQWLRDFYSDFFSGPDADSQHPGSPYPSDRHDGCYINYPDKDMLAFEYWPRLYYGDLYPFLQDVKRRYDPNNIFHHAMSIRI